MRRDQQRVFSSVAALVHWLEAAPTGTTLQATALREILEPLAGGTRLIQNHRSEADPESPTPTWRERLWTAPAEVRLGARELAEALGRPVSWVYRRTGPKSHRSPLPHRRLDGELVFVVGEIRCWLDQQEEVVAKHGPCGF
jgi:hypothetical protein